MNFTEFDCLAWLYDKHWGYMGREIFPVIKKMMLDRLPRNARVLDLCCGTGQLCKILYAQGCKVTGLDGSKEMLRYAKELVPEAEFIADDARSFSLPASFDGVVSTFDSLNYILLREELERTFRNVFNALMNGGIFIFDMNLEQRYRLEWNGKDAFVEKDYVCVIRPEYIPREKIARWNITMFTLKSDGWQRLDRTHMQRCYSEEEIKGALKAGGFIGVEVYDLHQELLKMKRPGKALFVCRKPANMQAPRQGNPVRFFGESIGIIRRWLKLTHE